MAYCLRSFVETLDQVLNPHKYYKKWILDHHHRPQIQSLFDNATSLQDFLDKSSPLIQERIASLEDQIMDAAQKGADTLETIITDQILLNPMDQSFTIIPPDLGQVMRVFEDAKEEMSKIKNGSQSWDNKVSPPVSTTHYPDSKLVVGVEEDLKKLRSRLTSARRELDIIPIVGMGGIGKTTLARILYDEFSSKSHFDRCAWVTVSQSYNPQQILKTLLTCVTEKGKAELESGDVISTLYQTLFGRRYLIVLDDIWSEKAWDDLKRAFVETNQGSRIVFTTRETSLVDYVQSISHEMQLMDSDKSWELLSGKVFVGESCPPEFEEIGKGISLSCQGLPLALQVIGGLLANSQRSKDNWWNIAGNVSSLIANTDDQCARIFSWSFAHLPHYLKPCLLYMSAFPEDYEIHASTLIKLWIAEGFLYPVPDKSLAESAEIHLKSLVDRNLIFVRKMRWNGKAKSFGIHDLLRELCMRKAEEKKFLFFKDKNTKILQKDIGFRRISVHSIYDYDESLKLTSFVRSFLSPSRYRQKQKWESGWCYKSSLLRVLHELDYGSEQNEMILQLVNLRYLTILSFYSPAIRGISVLTNLQTLKVGKLESLAIIEHLPQLKHLKFESLEDSSNSFEISRPHENLHYLAFLPVHLLTRLHGKVPNLTKLKLFTIRKLDDSVVDLSCFQKLESLKFLDDRTPNLTLPPSLKKLKLFRCEISETLVNEIGNLPRLQFLKLHDCEFENETWEPIEGQFRQLQHLEIKWSNLVNWLATEINFPVLRHLVLEECHDLSEIPCDIGGIDTLETIQLDLCMASVFDSARTILEQQLDLGNTLLKLQLGKSLEDEEKKIIARSVEYNGTLTIEGYTYPGSIFAIDGRTYPFSFPHLIRYLRLEKCGVRQTVLSAAGVLLELQDLTLKKCYFVDSTWEPSEGQFLQLQNLRIYTSENLVNWLATENHFPVLQNLVIKECHDLNDIPIGFGRIETLEVIKIEDCKPSLNDSARIILDEQRKLGNTVFKLRLLCQGEEEDVPESVSEDVPEPVSQDVPELEEDKSSGIEALEEDVDGLPCKKGFVKKLNRAIWRILFCRQRV